MTQIESAIGASNREGEQQKYHAAYELPHYHMGTGRMADAVHDLSALPVRGSYLDVGCGRGEMLHHAASMGFVSVRGVEVVPELIDGTRIVRGEAHDLPFADKSSDVVTLFDVIEHLLPGDDEAVCREMARVARAHILLTANNRPSHMPDGTDLHINIRAYDEWDRLFRDWFAGATVTWNKGPRQYVSEGWRIDL